MSSNWPKVHFGDVLTIVSRPTAVQPDRPYRVLGMRWYAQGLFLKEKKHGQEIRAKEVYRVELGDFIYNRLFAWKGSFGVVDESTDGGFVSGEFPCFRVDTSRANARFLLLYLSQERVWDEISRNSSGQTNISRLRLKERDFLNMEIPLPSLAQQQRFVARVDALARRVEEARGLRRRAAEQTEALLRSIVFNSSTDTTLTRMGDLVRQREPDVIVHQDEEYRFAGVYCFGRGVFRGQVKSGMDFAYPRLTRLKAGDFVYPKLMAWEGALGVVPPECDGLVVSTEFPVFEINQNRVFPETLDVYFRTPRVWPALSGASTGTNVRRRRLHPNRFLDFLIPLPSMSVQLQLRDVKAKVDGLHRLQAETQEELDALMPSILSKAFAGEL